MSLAASSSSAAVLTDASLLLFIAEYLDLPSIIRLSAVGRVSHLPRTIAYFRLLSLLGKFIGDASAFVETMSQTKCIIGGLALVQYFNGPTHRDENPRLDVFIPKSQCEPVRLHLFKEGYAIQELASSSVKSVLKVIFLGRKGHNSIGDGGIGSILHMPGINLIVSSTDSPYYPLFDYHCTAGVAYCTSNSYVCLYPDALSQGFSVRQKPYSEFFRIAASNVPNLNTYKSMSHLYGLQACGSLCGNLQRHFRDRYCFRINFRPHRPSGDEDLELTISSFFRSSGCWNSRCKTNDVSILIPVLESRSISNGNFSILSLIRAQLQMCIDAHADLLHIVEVLKEQRAILFNRAVVFAKLTQDFILQQANTLESGLLQEPRCSESSPINTDVQLAHGAAQLCGYVVKHLPKLLTWKRHYVRPKDRGSVLDGIHIRRALLRTSLINLRNDVENNPCTTLMIPCAALDLANQLVEDYIIIFFDVLELQASMTPDLQIIKFQASMAVNPLEENHIKTAIINSFTRRAAATKLYKLDNSLNNLECKLCTL